MTEFRHPGEMMESSMEGAGMPMGSERAGYTTQAVEVMAAASRRLRAHSHLYFELERSAQSGIDVTVRHYPAQDAALRDYGDLVYTRDPLTQPFRDWLLDANASAQDPRFVALGRLPRLDRARYEASFLHRAGIGDVIGLGIPVSIGGQVRVLCFGFHRGTGDPSFTSSDARILMRLAEDLRLRGENLALREASSLQGEVTRLLAAESGQDWALLDEQFRVRQASVAREAVQEADHLNEAGAALRKHLARGAAGKTVGRTLFRAGPHGFDAVRVPTGSASWWLVRPAPWSGPEPDANQIIAALTGREREVMRLLTRGRSNPELAGDLAITVNTVENHLRSIYAKLGVSSRGQAVAHAANQKTWRKAAHRD